MQAYSEEEFYVREYTYKASDLDSRVSARNNALKLIKAGVLEEIITFVSTASELGQSQEGDEFRSAFIRKSTSKSAGFVGARVLKEKWTGDEMWLKAEVRVDPEEVRAELKKSLTRVESNAKIENNPKVSYSQKEIEKIPEPQLIVPETLITPDYSHFKFAAMFSQALSLIQPIKLMVVMHYTSNGEWPTSIEQIGIAEGDTNDGRYIDRIKLGSSGLILTTLGKDFGTERVIKMSPRSIMGGTSIRWNCTSNLSQKLLMMLPGSSCKFDKTL